MNDKQIQEKLDRARRLGFANATAHIPEQYATVITQSYERQAQNRAANYRKVRAQIVGN